MKTRILAGLLLSPLLLVVWLGGWPLLFATFFVGALGLREFFTSFEKLGIKASLPIGWGALVVLYGILILKGTLIHFQLWFFGVILFSLLMLFQIEKRKLEDAMATITGIFYIVFSSAHVVMIDQIPGYEPMTWLVLITAFGTDTMAYFTGVFLGKHKLCPKISPKKTVEGALGGLAGSVIFASLFFWVYDSSLVLHGVTLGLLGGILSQFGDLTASIFKRKMGVKDYGTLIPGHGGILDRFDSVLFTAPTVYYYITMVLLH